MASLVVLERHLWLTLTEIKDADKVSFLDAPISPSGLFGPAVEGFAECFTEAQKAMAGPPTKRPLLENLFSPRSFPGAEGIVFVANTGPVQAPMQPSTVIVEKIKHKNSQKESSFR